MATSQLLAELMVQPGLLCGLLSHSCGLVQFGVQFLDRIHAKEDRWRTSMSLHSWLLEVCSFFLLARHSKQHSKMSSYHILVPCQCPPADTGHGEYQLSTCLDLAVSWLLMQQLQPHQETAGVRCVYVQRFGNMRGKHLQWDAQAVVLWPQPQVRGERLIKKRSWGQRVHPKTEGHLKIPQLFSWGDKFILSL